MVVIKHVYNIVRSVIVTVLVTVIAVFVAAYLLLLVPSVQDAIKHKGEQAASEFLKTKVRIGRVSIQPFNQVLLYDVSIPDQHGDSLLNVNKLAAGISLYNLVVNSKIVVTYGELIGLSAHVTKQCPDSATNAQFLIDALKSKPGSKPKPYDVTVHNIVIRKGSVTYDVLSEAPKTGRFDKNHISLYNLKADVELPKIKNDDFDVVVKRLAFNEKNGFMLKNLAAHATVTGTRASLSDIQIELPGTLLLPEDISLEYSSLKTIGKEIKTRPLSLTIANNYITLADLQCFEPKLAAFAEPLQLTISAYGTIDDITIKVLSVKTKSNRLAIEMRGRLRNVTNKSRIAFNVPHIKVNANATEVAKLTQNIVKLNADVLDKVLKCGNIGIDGSASGTPKHIKYAGTLATSLGTVSLNGSYASAQGSKLVDGHVETGGFNLGRLLDNENLLGSLAVNADANVAIGQNKSIRLNGTVGYVDLKGYRYHNITTDIEASATSASGHINVNDPNFLLDLNGDAKIVSGVKHLALDVKARNVNLARLHLINKYPDKSASLDGHVTLTGKNVDDVLGSVQFSNVEFVDAQDKGVHLDNLSLTSEHDAAGHKKISVASDFINGEMTGEFKISSLVQCLKGAVDKVLPGVLAYKQYRKPYTGNNVIDYNFTIEPSDELQSLVKLPVKLIYTTTIAGAIDDRNDSISLRCNAPYLLQGKKIIEGTSLTADVIGETAKVRLLTKVPTKNGKTDIELEGTAHNGVCDVVAGWRINRSHAYHGKLSLTASLQRHDNGKLETDINVNPTEIVVNDTVWNVNSGNVNACDNVIEVRDLFANCEKQFIKIGGKVSKDPDDELCVSLNDINLDYIFETLNIDNVKFGGRAVGKFYASDLLSGAPRIATPDLHVAGLKYNNALMGDAKIVSSWDNSAKAVNLSADLTQSNGGHSYINGGIYVADDSLRLTFNADRANVEFMKPFMAAFAADVKGYASGHAVLFGDFHNIDLYGDLYVQDLMLKIAYTNVYYSCTDSIHITPGNIRFNGIKMKDRDNHQAILGGWLKHNAFHDPKFSFSITNARDFLCYDIGPNPDTHWYGTIYGNGSAFVSGEPGVVKISVNMQTAPRSKFTFELSNSQKASEYNFITFRDRDAASGKKAAVADTVDSIPAIVRMYANQNKPKEESTPTVYSINLQGDITTDAQLTMLMDPAGGDKIKAVGAGNMRLAYNNADDKFEMYGKYTLERGSYNFTLQDIIIRDFNIRSGSSISFNGDPYSAILDINATYSLNANILDLDQSFAEDKELNRTNVPVYAVLMAKGAMSQPDISFDLEFPTLTSEAYRKIKSIISTEDMMNRQIIYLLALNRFYTPDYMNNVKNNNELTSVASSTISSQLSNLLGQISDKWSISPNFRSNKGDFSDMEVDLALSSQLLNNRLIFNGNFGYRDNTYNTRNSNFIGDFDIEYLINKKGTIRLKAYNHFNDQNYYVRNAMTTQGVGIMFKRDFDRLFDFRRKQSQAAADSTKHHGKKSTDGSDSTHVKK